MAITVPDVDWFDPTILHRQLDGRYAPVRERVRAILRRPELEPPIAPPTPEYREQVLRWCQLLADEGLPLYGLPKEYGGENDPGAVVAMFETLALGDLSLLIKFGVQFGLWGGAVLHLGTREHHERYLRQIGSLELPGCFAMTETGHGSNVQHLETTATYDPASSEFVIDTPLERARKEFIGNAADHGRTAAVFAQLIVDAESHGVHTLVVPLRDEHGALLPGVEIEDCGEKLGLNGVDNGMIWFRGVRVPREALLNRYGNVTAEGRYESPIDDVNKRFFTMLGTLVQGRVCVAAASVTAAKTALTIAVRYGLRRRQFGPSGQMEVPILDYRTQQRRLMPRLAKTFALHFAQQELTAKFHHVFAGEEVSDRERRHLESLAAGMKAIATWHSIDTIQQCRECCGGSGYMAVNRFAALKADVDIFTTFEGDNTVLILLAARGLLTDYSHDFGGMSPAEMVTFVAGQAVETIVERLFARKIGQVIADAVPIGGDGNENWYDREQQLDLFNWRQGHIVASVANRFRAGLSQGFDPFEVFRAVGDHAADAARAWIDVVLLEAFGRAIDECENDQVKQALNLVCDLFALQTIEADVGFYQAHGRFTGSRSKSLTREVNRLCNKVMAHSELLVDAFGIPDEILRAPIGLRDRGTVGADV
ncbi:MAG TPA: acyl-CoA dehydrogenase [Solirubrobacteraceae bacterium]|nr:acyl-CoA dehydrogenase [Solirubrobacteraceae bacterium]